MVCSQKNVIGMHIVGSVLCCADEAVAALVAAHIPWVGADGRADQIRPATLRRLFADPVVDIAAISRPKSCRKGGQAWMNSGASASRSF
jgi:hypothetical protein